MTDLRGACHVQEPIDIPVNPGVVLSEPIRYEGEFENTRRDLKVVIVTGDRAIPIPRERIKHLGQTLVIDPPPPAGRLEIEHSVIDGIHDTLDRNGVPPHGRTLMVNGDNFMIRGPESMEPWRHPFGPGPRQARGSKAKRRAARKAQRKARRAARN